MRASAHAEPCSARRAMQHTPSHAAHAGPCGTRRAMQHTQSHAAHAEPCLAAVVAGHAGLPDAAQDRPGAARRTLCVWCGAPGQRARRFWPGQGRQPRVLRAVRAAGGRAHAAMPPCVAHKRACARACVRACCLAPTQGSVAVLDGGEVEGCPHNLRFLMLCTLCVGSTRSRGLLQAYAHCEGAGRCCALSSSCRDIKSGEFCVGSKYSFIELRVINSNLLFYVAAGGLAATALLRDTLLLFFCCLCTCHNKIQIICAVQRPPCCALL